MEEYEIYKHKKTGNVYTLLMDGLIECTNGREDKTYVLYKNVLGKRFVRERDEFMEKFEKVEAAHGHEAD